MDEEIVEGEDIALEFAFLEFLGCGVEEFELEGEEIIIPSVGEGLGVVEKGMGGGARSAFGGVVFEIFGGESDEGEVIGGLGVGVLEAMVEGIEDGGGEFDFFEIALCPSFGIGKDLAESGFAVGPSFLEIIESGEEGGLGGGEVSGVVRGEDFESGVAGDFGEEIDEGRGGEVAIDGEGGEAWGGGVKLGTPEVIGDFLEEGLGIGEEFGIEGLGGFEGAFLEETLAEAVDGGDGGVVELAEGGFEAGAISGSVGEVRVAKFFEERVFCGGGGSEEREGEVEAGADAVAEFGGGGDGESGNEDGVNGEIYFDDEAEEEGGEGVSFARAGAGFDAGDAEGEWDGGEMERE